MIFYKELIKNQDIYIFLEMRNKCLQFMRTGSFIILKGLLIPTRGYNRLTRPVVVVAALY